MSISPYVVGRAPSEFFIPMIRTSDGFEHMSADTGQVFAMVGFHGKFSTEVIEALPGASAEDVYQEAIVETITTSSVGYTMTPSLAGGPPRAQATVINLA